MTEEDPFFDGGRPCESVDFDYPDEQVADDLARVRRQTILRLIGFLAQGATPEAMGVRCIVLAHLLRLPGAPVTQRDLAAVLGVTEGAVSQRLKSLREKMRALSAD